MSEQTHKCVCSDSNSLLLLLGSILSLVQASKFLQVHWLQYIHGQATGRWQISLSGFFPQMINSRREVAWVADNSFLQETGSFMDCTKEFYDDYYHPLISVLIIDIISISLDLALMVILANNKRLFNVQQQQQYLVFPQTVFSFLSPMWLEWNGTLAGGSAIVPSHALKNV